MKKLLLGFIVGTVSVSFGIPVFAVGTCTCTMTNVDAPYSACSATTEKEIEPGNTIINLANSVESSIQNACSAAVHSVEITPHPSRGNLTLDSSTCVDSFEGANISIYPKKLPDGSRDDDNELRDSLDFVLDITCSFTSSTVVLSTSTASTFEPPANVPLINPLTGTASAQDIPTFVGGIIQRLLGILGSISLVVFMYGAFKWITSEGESDDIEEGTHTMAYAAIGILVIFASYGILQSVIKGITSGG